MVLKQHPNVMHDCDILNLKRHAPSPQALPVPSPYTWPPASGKDIFENVSTLLTCKTAPEEDGDRFWEDIADLELNDYDTRTEADEYNTRHEVNNYTNINNLRRQLLSLLWRLRKIKTVVW